MGTAGQAPSEHSNHWLLSYDISTKDSSHPGDSPLSQSKLMKPPSPHRAAGWILLRLSFFGGRTNSTTFKTSLKEELILEASVWLSRLSVRLLLSLRS